MEAASESGRLERSPMMAGPSRLLAARHGSFGEVRPCAVQCSEKTMRYGVDAHFQVMGECIMTVVHAGGLRL